MVWSVGRVASGNMTHQSGFELISTVGVHERDETRRDGRCDYCGRRDGQRCDARVWLTCMMNSLIARACAWIRHDKRTGASSVMRSLGFQAFGATHIHCLRHLIHSGRDTFHYEASKMTVDTGNGMPRRGWKRQLWTTWV
jgi:hypothetical protein